VSPRSQRQRVRVSSAVAIACLAAVALGAWIGTGIRHHRAERKAQQAAQVARERAESQRRAERREVLEERSSEALDDAVDRANERLRRAARAGQRRAVARAEAQLAVATRRRDAAQGATEKPPKDPYARELQRFGFKRPPLVAQQITSSGDDHVLFVAVMRPYFCFKSVSERVGAVRRAYLPIERRLVHAGVHDFEMIVGPASTGAPMRADAFAVARGGGVRLTDRGRRC